MAFSANITTTASLDFELLKEIGQEGKNSTVHLAHDKQLDAELVIKIIEKSKFKDPSDFYSESKRLYDSEHQHVVQVKYACQDNDNIYLAMPFYKNGSLKTLMDNRFLTVREIVRYSIQFLLGLNNIHVKNLLHFDVKPDNILISDTDEALISDFGITKNMDAQGLASATQIYSLNTPPETFKQTQHSILYDIYSAGVTIYRLCNGNEAFYSQRKQYADSNALAAAITSGKFPDRTSYLPHIPVSLRRVINKAINVNPDNRHDTVLDLINQLSPINELLNWQYTPFADRYEWVLDTSESITRVTFIWTGGNRNTVTTKTFKESNKTQNISAGTLNNLAVKDVNKKIQDLLLSLER